MEVKIRDWTRADLPVVSNEWSAFCLTVSRFDMRMKPHPERHLNEWLDLRFREPTSFGLIAEGDGRHAGFLLARVDLWESTPPIIHPRKLGIIDAIYVVDEFRHSGVARQLIEWAFAKMRQRKAVAVETIYDASNEASARMWQQAGLKPWMVHAYRML
jgi:GNAT superfamily N-acetyltransferase